MELLLARARRTPERWAYAFLGNGEDEDGRVTYADLDFQARALASRLRRVSSSGDRALLLLPSGPEFITAFLGCLYAGVVAVPAYPPRSRRSLPRLETILRDADARVVLTTSQTARRSHGWIASSEGFRGTEWLVVEDDEAGESRRLAEAWEPPEVGAESLAFLQYTSGSTADPKGVMVTHGNLLANQEVIRRAFRQDETSVIVSWLPLFHDMGLVGTVLQPLYVGAPGVIMPPAAFLQSPIRWLRAIHRYRGTTSGGPDFGYQLCLEKIRPDERVGLDLSSWQLAFNGAEPVRAATLEGFTRAFAPAGLRPEAFYPCFGLAEATLFVTGGRADRPARMARFSAAALEDSAAEPADPKAPTGHGAGSPEGDEGSRAADLVSCGTVWGEHRLRVADPETGAELPPGRIGELWLTGPSVAAGYWGRPLDTERVFAARSTDGEGPFLRTGDLGFVVAGEVFVTGRLKDLIILRGRNFYPQDFETAAEAAHADLVRGRSAAFSVEEAGEERLVVVAELLRRRGGDLDIEEVAGAIRRAIAEAFEVQVDEVILIRAGTLPRTSSGKVRRGACRTARQAGSLVILGRSGREQSGLPGETDDFPGLLGADLSGADLSGVDLLAAYREGCGALLVAWLRRTTASLCRVPVAKVPADEPLTALGLDSLGAAGLQRAVEEVFGASLELEELLSGATLSELAERIRARHAGLPELRRAERAEAEPFPLSVGQQALFFLDRLAPESTVFNLARAARVRGALDLDALRRALGDLAERHPALASRFTGEGEALRQHPSACPEIDFEFFSGPSDAEGLRRRFEEEAARPFRLDAGPPIRWRLAVQGSDEAVLLVVVHHLVADFWSMVNLLSDLERLYIWRRDGGRGTSLLPPTAAGLGDAVAWERELLAGAEAERLRRFWLQQLRGAPRVLELPTDRPRPAVQSFRGAACAFALPGDVSAALRRLARQHDATLFMALLTLFQTLLHRVSGQRDLLVGAPTSGRNRAAFASLVGYFVNMMPVRSRPEDAGFGTHLDRQRERILEVFAHRRYPFQRLVDEIQPERDASRYPVFQTIFVLHQAWRPEWEALTSFAVDAASEGLPWAGLDLAPFPLRDRVSAVDLTLAMADGGDALHGSLQYASDLFDGSTIARLLGQLAVLARSAVHEPGRPVVSLARLTAAEQAQLHREWNDTAAAPPADGEAWIHRLIEGRARDCPDAVALVGRREQLSYGELDRRANRLARRLRQLGAGPEVRVGICLRRSPDMVTALLAVLKAGAAYVPIDPDYPRRRRELILEDAAVALLLQDAPDAGGTTGGADGERLPGVTSLQLDEELARTVHLSSEPLPRGTELPGALAYLIYTSGSTGRPKGVMAPHASVANLFVALDRIFGTEPGRFLAAASISFDMSVGEIYWVLYRGYRLVIRETHALLGSESAEGADGEAAIETVPEQILRHGVIDHQLTPSALTALKDDPMMAEALARMRYVVVGGEALPPALARWASSRVGGAMLNLYGPTETTVYAGGSSVDGIGPVTIGGPVANGAFYVVDPRHAFVGIGEAGELLIGGRGVVRGYFRRPGLTADRFLPDPFAGKPGARLYRTGDRVRWLADGRIDFLGRIDQQVKVRGYRIELGEIEVVLTQHPAVRRAVVVLARDGAEDLGSVHLVAYVEPEAARGAEAAPGAEAGSQGFDLADLRSHVETILPAYCRPSVYAVIDELPETSSGKVDRRNLPDPAAVGGSGGKQGPGRGAETDLERAVLRVWRELLPGGEPRVDDNFFEVGGNSLLLIEARSRLQSAFGREVPLSLLLHHQTVEDLARQLEAHWAEEGGSPRASAAPLPRAPRDRPAPLSFPQERLWLLERMAKSRSAFHVTTAFRLRGDLRPAALAAAVTEVYRRHEMLRTRLDDADGDPGQRVLAAEPVLPAVVDLRRLPGTEAGRKTEARRLAESLGERSWDFRDGRMLRTLLARLGDAENLLVLSIHHLAFDARSQEILLGELAEVYAAHVQGRPPELPGLDAQYADYAWWQRRAAEDGPLTEQLAYWRRQLASPPPPAALPGERARSGAPELRGELLRFELSPAVSSAVRRLAREEACTVFTTLLAAFGVLLHQYTGQEDLMVGTNVANRDRQEVWNLIGFFVNNLTLRLDLGGAPTFRRLLARVQRMALDAYAHQEVPFEKVLAEVRGSGGGRAEGLFKVMFVMQSIAPETWSMPGVETSLLDLGYTTANFDLTVFLAEGEERVRGAFLFDTALFDRASVERMAGHFETLIESVIDAPDDPIDRFALQADPVAALAADAFNQEIF